MTEKRMIGLDDLNKIIDRMINEHNSSAEECCQELSDSERADCHMSAAQALGELKIEINNPESLINVSENIQQTLNVEETKKIINNGM